MGKDRGSEARGISNRLVDKLIGIGTASEDVFVTSSINSVFTTFSFKFIFVIVSSYFITQIVPLSVDCLLANKDQILYIGT